MEEVKCFRCNKDLDQTAFHIYEIQYPELVKMGSADFLPQTTKLVKHYWCEDCKPDSYDDLHPQQIRDLVIRYDKDK